MRHDNMASPIVKVFSGEVKCKILVLRRLVPQIQRLKYSDWQEDNFAKKTTIGLTGYEKEEVHPETPAAGEYDVTPPKGKIYDKKPFPIELQVGTRYSWCVCGHSKSQPLCDGTHKRVYEELKGQLDPRTIKKFVPHRFTVSESKQYWLCNCKQTSNRPFCDGTHKSAEIQKKKI